jgi:hypothetical protein
MDSPICDHIETTGIIRRSLLFALLLQAGVCLFGYPCYLNVNSDEMRLPEGQKKVTSKIWLS